MIAVLFTSTFSFTATVCLKLSTVAVVQHLIVLQSYAIAVY